MAHPMAAYASVHQQVQVAQTVKRTTNLVMIIVIVSLVMSFLIVGLVMGVVMLGIAR